MMKLYLTRRKYLFKLKQCLTSVLLENKDILLSRFNEKNNHFKQKNGKMSPVLYIEHREVLFFLIIHISHRYIFLKSTLTTKIPNIIFLCYKITLLIMKLLI